MRFVLIIVVLLSFMLAACGGTSGIPLTEQPLGDDLAQVDAISEVVDVEDDMIHIDAVLGVNSCNINADGENGDCDVPSELRCGNDDIRVCDEDCRSYLTEYKDGAEGCLKDWMEANYVDKTFSSEKEYCFESDEDYELAKGSSFCDTSGGDETDTTDGDTTTDSCEGATLSCPGSYDCDTCGECLLSGDPECTNTDPCPDPDESMCYACGDSTCETQSDCDTLKAVC